MVNWRCPRHPRAGGAEVSTLHVLKGLSQRGHQITWFSSSAPNLPKLETTDRIHYIRIGTELTVRWHFYKWMRLNHTSYDVIIEQVNTLPFLSMFYVSIPVISYIHQVAQELWFYQFPLPVALAGYAIESVLLYALKTTPAIVGSRSTLVSIDRYGHKAARWLVPYGVNKISHSEPPKRVSSLEAFNLIMVSRFIAHKRISHAIRAMVLLARQPIPYILHVVGNNQNDEGEQLKHLAIDLHIDDRVLFHGQVTDEALMSLYASANAVLSTSVREGWGLTISEANSQGVPSVVYPSPGLIDSTIHGCNGIVCRGSTPQALAEGITLLVHNYDAIIYNLRTFWPHLTHTWDSTTTRIELILQTSVTSVSRNS